MRKDNPLALGYYSPGDVREQGVTLVKQYTPDFYKLITCKSLRKSGFEEVEPQKRQPRCTNSQKLENNLARVKSKVFELAMCNDFDYFVTLTLDGEKLDRYDLAGFKKKLHKFINNYSRGGTKIQYLLIPEQHKDGAWHMHGMITGIRPDDLKKNDNGYLSWVSYSKRFGYMSLDPIREKEACCRYITKYITKDLGTGVGMNQQSYLCSQGLKRSTLLARVQFDTGNIEYDYEHEKGFTKIKIYHDDEFLSSLELI